MRWLGALLLFSTLAVAQALSPVVAELLRELSRQEVQALGPRPTVRAAASAIPAERRDAVAAGLKRLEPGASFQTLTELTHAYLYLAQPNEADRVSRLALHTRPDVEGLAFRAWAAQQVGDVDGAAEAAREALKLAPGRPDIVAILKLTEGRARTDRGPSEQPKPATVVAPVKDSPVFEGNARRREAERLLAEATRAKKMGDNDRAAVLVRRAAEADPDSTELKESVVAQNHPARPDMSAAALSLLRTTATGKEIAESIEANRIPIRPASNLPGSAAAMYDFESGTVFLGPTFATEPPVVQALLLGHEGYHAIQDIRYRVAPVLETEQDAWLRTMAIYWELQEGGNRPLPPQHWVQFYSPAFDNAVRNGNASAFYSYVKVSYEEDAALRKDVEVAVLPQLLRRPMRTLLDVIYFPAFMNAVPAFRLQLSVMGNLVNGWEPLRNAHLRREEEQKWFSDWLKRRPAR